MSISRRTIDTLLDLVEIKLSSIQVIDREDAKELETLEACRRDLKAMQAFIAESRPKRGRKPGRRAAA